MFTAGFFLRFDGEDWEVTDDVIKDPKDIYGDKA